MKKRIIFLCALLSAFSLVAQKNIKTVQQKTNVINRALKNNKKISVQALDAISGAATTTNALGPVVPVFGYDDGSGNNAFDAMLQAFPGAASLKTGTDANRTLAGAPVDNYAVQGVHVYLCANTPFTRALRSSMGIDSMDLDVSDMSPTGALVDIIVFLNAAGAQVPLQVVGKKLVYGSAANNNQAYSPEYILNPAITHYLSLVAGALPEFQYLYPINTSKDPVASGKSNTDIDAYYAAVGKISTVLEQQLLEHKKALLAQYQNGPFGKDLLVPDNNILPSSYLYTGMNCPLIPMGDDTVSDYIIPVYNDGSNVTTCSITDSHVNYYLGIVTGIQYNKVDGYLVPFSFGYSCVTQGKDGKYTTTGAKYPTNNYVIWTSFNTSVATPDQITAARTKWLADLATFNKSVISPYDAVGWDFSKPLLSGSSVAGGKIIARLFSSASAVNGCPIWVLANSPLDYGIFIATNDPTSSPIIPIQSKDFGDSTVFIDLVSGYVITPAGEYKTDSFGYTSRVSADMLLSSLGYDSGNYVQSGTGINVGDVNTKNAFTSSFTAKYKLLQTQYNYHKNEKLYPIPFGAKILGIYRGDKQAGSYIYWEYNGNQMTDYFLTFHMADPNVPNDTAKIGVALDSKTNYIVSLVNGQIYSLSGKSGQCTQDEINDMIEIYGGLWDQDIKDRIAELSVIDATLMAQLKAEADANAAAAANYKPTILTESDTDRAAVAQRLDATNFLLYPYDELKQDPSTGKYYRVEADDTTSATATPTYSYLDFNAPNSGVSATGAATQIALIFNGAGESQLSFDGVSMYNYRKMYGVSVASDGTQKLGAASIHSILVMSSGDKTTFASSSFVPGSSSATMLGSSDPKFPTRGISSVVSGDQTYYFYYSTVMKGYYALVEDKTLGESYWMCMLDGSKYNLDGTNKPSYSPVAFGANFDSTSTAEKNNLLLAYQGYTGNMNCIMPNQSNANVYTEFFSNTTTVPYVTTDGSVINTMVAGSSPYNGVPVAQAAEGSAITLSNSTSMATMYDVYWDTEKATEYDVDANYKWTRLRLMNNSDADKMYLYIVLNSSNVIEYAIFDGALYNQSSAESRTYNPVLDATASPITITSSIDSNTFVAYIQAVQTNTSASYSYQYYFDALSADRLTDQQLTVWKMQPVASSSAQIVLAKNMDLNNLSEVSVSDVLSAGGTPNLSAYNVRSDDDAGIFYARYSDGYDVDLATGVKYDASSGVTTGYSLLFADLSAFLAKLNVSVGTTSADDPTPCLWSYPVVATTAV